MGNDQIKCVMVLDEELPTGLQVNTAGVLALTLGHRLDSVIGPDVVDGSGRAHVGITTIPIPILKAKGDLVRDIRLKAEGTEDLLVVDVTDAAQTTKTYDDYTRKIAAISSEGLKYLGVVLYGNKKAVNKLTGSLPLLR